MLVLSVGICDSDSECIPLRSRKEFRRSFPIFQDLFTPTLRVDKGDTFEMIRGGSSEFQRNKSHKESHLSLKYPRLDTTSNKENIISPASRRVSSPIDEFRTHSLTDTPPSHSSIKRKRQPLSRLSLLRMNLHKNNDTSSLISDNVEESGANRCNMKDVEGTSDIL